MAKTRPEDFNITDYKWVDGELHTNQSVIISAEGLKELPFKFGIVKGDFNCSTNELVTLKNSPRIVTGNFWCYDNKLTDLKYFPISVDGEIDCENNSITTLVDLKLIKIKNEINLSNNNIRSLKGLPDKIGKTLKINNNPISNIDPVKSVNGVIQLYNTKIAYLPEDFFARSVVAVFGGNQISISEFNKKYFNKKLIVHTIREIRNET